MTKSKLIPILIILLAVPFSTNAQPIIGFWTVNEVKVGDRNLTPVAKWFRYNKEKNYEAGNGWTQNDIGTWEYNEAKKEFLPESRNGRDEYGPFKVEFSEEGMTWERMEDGMKVVVSLSRLSEMPMSPKDSIAGNWELVSVVKDGEDITSTYNQEKKETIFISWAETYSKTGSDGSQSFGYWHMDAHKPEFHLIDFNREVDFQVFVVSFKEDLLMMRAKEDGMVFTYRRR